ncbi:MAG TPA: MBL fold metallo-hydrolase [Polyangiaceae bacterium]|nr:MBL fold metallo-hydrolase [Polyangiaceae bacterium]
MPTFVKFWGTRGSIPTPGHKTRRYGGNTSCVEVRIDDTVFVCDGGTGLRELGVDLLNRTDRVTAHLFFSHTHWDHIQGFPFFTPAYSPASKLHVYDVKKNDQRVQRLLLGQMQSEYFPVSFGDLGAQISFSDLDSGEKTIDGTRVAHIEQTHPGRSFAYSFVKNGCKICYATDNELDLVITNEAEAVRDPFVLRKLPEPIVRFAKESDLLIADGQYTDEEYPKKKGWGHARATTAVDLAIQAGVKQLAIYHHDPMHPDESLDDIIDGCRKRVALLGGRTVVFGAREGVELKLA